MDSEIKQNVTFDGNIYLFYACDVGDDINLDQIENMRSIIKNPQKNPRFFKNYHIPLAISLPVEGSAHPVNAKINSFGALSLMYKIPFKQTLADLRSHFGRITEDCALRAEHDARMLYKKIEPHITHPHFSNMYTWYALIQINPNAAVKEPQDLRAHYAAEIASILRFENTTLSEYQINDIWQSAIGYFRGDLVLVDTDAACIYNYAQEDVLDLFEFAIIQSLELHYFDKILDQKLNGIYDGTVKQFPTQAYLPLIGTFMNDPIEHLGKMKVDISVITERLESTIKLAGEPYLSEMYALLEENLDLKTWKESIDRKLKIVESVQRNHQHKIETSREDLVSLLILVLIFIEVIVALHK